MLYFLALIQPFIHSLTHHWQRAIPNKVLGPHEEFGVQWTCNFKTQKLHLDGHRQWDLIQDNRFDGGSYRLQCSLMGFSLDLNNTGFILKQLLFDSHYRCRVLFFSSFLHKKQNILVCLQGQSILFLRVMTLDILQMHAQMHNFIEWLYGWRNSLR